MKKQTVVILWSCAVLLIVVCCVGVYIFGRIDEKSRTDGVEVFSCSVTEISSYAVETENESYRLLRSGGSWTLDGNGVALIDAEKADGLVGYAAHIFANGTAKENSFEPTDVQKVLIELTDGSKCEISFVGENGDLSVFTVSGDEKIYTMYKANRDILTPTADSLRHLEVFETDGTESLDFYEYRDYDKSVVRVRRKNGDELMKSDTNKYIMTLPYIRSADDERFEQQIAVKLPLIKASGFADDYPESLEKYGLDEESAACLTAEYGEMTTRLYLGDTVGGQVYALKESGGGVFTISASLLEFLQTEPFYLIEDGVLKAETDKISGADIRHGEEKLEIRSTESEGGKKYYINGKDKEGAVFDDIVRLLSEMKVSGELQSVPSGEAEIAIEVYYTAPRDVQKVELVASGDKSYAVFVNKKAEFAVDKKAVDDIIKEISELAEEPLKLKQER